MGGETNEGSTTWCDSDSCATGSKCYCSPQDKKPQKKALQEAPTKKGKPRKDNFALDYELFTVGNSSKHVKPTEAMSVKKSVEMAAVFADVKLSQSTDITNMKPSKAIKPKHHHKKRHDETIVSMKNVKNSTRSRSGEDFYKSSEVILRKDIEVTSKRVTKTEGYYQAVNARPVSASLEDSLGYLP